MADIYSHYSSPCQSQDGAACDQSAPLT